MEQGVIEVGNVETEVSTITWAYKKASLDEPAKFLYTVKDKDTEQQELVECMPEDFYCAMLLSIDPFIDPFKIEINETIQFKAESAMPQNKELRWIP